jgi:hypothetical protein
MELIEKPSLRNDTAAKVQDEFRRQILLGATAGLCYAGPTGATCDPYLYTCGLVVTANVYLQLSGARSLFPDK